MSVILVEPVTVFEFGVVVEVFGFGGTPPTDFRLCSLQPGVATSTTTRQQR